MEARQRGKRSSSRHQQNSPRPVSTSPHSAEPSEEENPLGISWRMSRWILICEVVVFLYQAFTRMELLKHSKEESKRCEAAISATLGLIACVYLTKIWGRKHVSTTAMLFFMLGNAYAFLFSHSTAR